MESINGGSDVTQSSDATNSDEECGNEETTDVESYGSEPMDHETAVDTLNATATDNTSSNYRTALLRSLKSIGHGSFAASGPLPDIYPGLCVDGLGKIGLPLSERDATALAHVCHEAPFGKGSETFVDPAVRKTWQINPDKIRFWNSNWARQVDLAVSKVSEGLGIIGGPGTVRADLHKMLLYEPGALFDTHRE